MIMPGVQKPHCSPPCSTNASWSGWSLPSCARPSIVVTSLPRDGLHGQQARAHRLLADDDGAGAAEALAAAVLRAREAEVGAQHPEERSIAVDVQLDGLAVEPERDGVFHRRPHWKGGQRAWVAPSRERLRSARTVVEYPDHPGIAAAVTVFDTDRRGARRATRFLDHPHPHGHVSKKRKVDLSNVLTPRAEQRERPGQHGKRIGTVEFPGR